MANVMELFYTESCVLCKKEITTNSRGYIKNTYVIVTDPIACSVTPISTVKSREKWGIHSTATCEVSLDLDDTIELDEISAIVIDGHRYIVENYEIYPKFMILNESVTFAVKRDNVRGCDETWEKS